MTPEAALAIALSCKTLDPSMARLMVGVAQWESGLDPLKIHRNPNGTFDYGLAQINTINLGWTKLTDPFEPCANLTAGLKVLLARYNGNPPDPDKVIYAAGVMTRVAQLNIAVPLVAAPAAAPLPASEPNDDIARPVGAGRENLAAHQ